MVRLIAKIETSVTSPSTANSAKVPTIAMPPIASGSRAATKLPKTSTSRARITGTAIDSAIARLVVTWVLTSLKVPPWPPARIVRPSWSPA